jgi:hypothetical protein
MPVRIKLNCHEEIDGKLTLRRRFVSGECRMLAARSFRSILVRVC